MNIQALARLPAQIPAQIPATPGACGPADRFLTERLTSCERVADRVAALGDTWGPIIGQEPFVVVWSLLSRLAQAGRARALTTACEPCRSALA